MEISLKRTLIHISPPKEEKLHGRIGIDYDGEIRVAIASYEDCMMGTAEPNSDGTRIYFSVKEHGLFIATSYWMFYPTDTGLDIIDELVLEMIESRGLMEGNMMTLSDFDVKLLISVDSL